MDHSEQPIQNKPHKTKKKKKKDDYWSSPQHTTASYGSVLLLVLSAIHMIDMNWFQAVVNGYILGFIAYYLYLYHEKFYKPPNKTESIVDVHAEIPHAQIPTQQQTRVRDDSQNLSQNMNAEFSALYKRTYSKIPAAAQVKLQDIQDLLGLMTQKINRSENLNSQIEMLKIQRIVNHYITPLLEHYTDLPVFLQERIQDDGISPNAMIVQQLTLIHDEVLKMTEHVYQDNVEALRNHGEFLKQKLLPHHFFNLEKDP
jgi:hypothetical protein